jgi:hypothetical protein
VIEGTADRMVCPCFRCNSFSKINEGLLYCVDADVVWVKVSMEDMEE